MTPTKDDALAALARLGDSSTLPDIERNSLETVIRVALTQTPVDVEALKVEISKGATPSYAHVVGHTIDYLASKGYLK